MTPPERAREGTGILSPAFPPSTNQAVIIWALNILEASNSCSAENLENLEYFASMELDLTTLPEELKQSIHKIKTLCSNYSFNLTTIQSSASLLYSKLVKEV